MNDERPYELVNIDSGAVIETSVRLTRRNAVERNRAYRQNGERNRWIPVGFDDDQNTMHLELVKVVQGRSNLYRFGSDRIHNADDFTRKNAAHLLDFQSNELHPDTVAMYRKKASETTMRKSARTKEHRAERVANKLCIDCGEPVQFLMQYCAEHQERKVRCGRRHHGAQRVEVLKRVGKAGLINFQDDL